MTSGILLLDKPSGLSSNAALQRVRRLVGAAKAGHVGSLDPLATGMLPICLGEATKIAGEILSGRKLYRFTVSLGTRTATGDLEGAVVESLPVPALDAQQLQAVLERFHGQLMQVPPMYSALKRGGQPLYRLARSGIEVAREPRAIEIFELRLVKSTAGSLELEALCSKGTYVRTLAEDIAVSLGTCGHVSSLRRLYVEPFVGAPMETLESIATAREAGAQPTIQPPDAPLQHLPAVHLQSAHALNIRHGQSLAMASHEPPGRRRLYDGEGIFMGLGELGADGRLSPRRLLRAD